MSVVIYCIACDYVRPHAMNPVRVTLRGLLSQLRSRLSPAFPMRCAEFSVFVLLAELEPEIEISLWIVQDVTGIVVFQNQPRWQQVSGGSNQLVGIRFRILDCWIPAEGLYWECWNYGTRLNRQRLYAIA